MPLKVNPNANSLAVDSKFTVDVSNSDVHVLVGSQAAVNMTGEYSQWEDAIKPDTLQASQLKSMAKLEKVDEVKEE